MARKRNTGLRSYRTAAATTRMLHKLRKVFPQNSYRTVQSPFAAYAFRYLIEVTGADGRVSYVGK